MSRGHHRARHAIVALAVFALVGVIATTRADGARADTCVSSITDGWGDRGPYEVRTTTLTNPAWRLGKKVTVYSPIGAPGPRPVVFFSHGFGGNFQWAYDDLVNQLASSGSIVVATPYPTLSTPGHMYDVLWDGDLAAVRSLAGSLSMDTSRIGFVGHSFGGGATPWLYAQALDQGWGANGGFLYILAPWYVLKITDQQFTTFPPSTKVLIEVYDDDTINDHRIAIDDIWQKLTTVPDTNKDYVMISATSNGACRYVADHMVPVTGPDAIYGPDAYDAWGVWRHGEALGACAWDSSSSGCDVALGNGSRAQTDMGRWQSDGSPVRPLVWMRDPVPMNCGIGETCLFRG